MVGGSTAFSALKPAAKAGIITRICLENFMCHSSLEMEFGEFVNFITGQNGSGKSAILTALCIAFGCRAKGTQRAATLKDFIKTGCSYAAVHVELKNQGGDAFKPEIYGDLISIERRIYVSSSTTVLKDRQGKRVSSRKDELRELVEHFNIDVENPCVIMTQDKSREFLHSGSEKDKFKFFFKATLLQQVSDLLEGIDHHLKTAREDIGDLEKTIRPVQKELNELQGKIKNMEHVEEISLQVQQLRKKLAWSWVYDVDRQLKEHCAKIEKLKDRIPRCQAKIDKLLVVLEELREEFSKKKAQVACMMETASEGRRMKDELQQRLSMATKEKLVLEEEHGRKFRQIEKKVKDVRLLEQQVREIQEQHAKDTQAEELEIENMLKDLQSEVDSANSILQSLMGEENDLSERQMTVKDEIRKIAEEVEGFEKKLREIQSYIRQLEQNKSNKVTAFGGERVLQLLRAIEKHHRRFRTSPIGPIGAHLTLVNGDTWAPAVEVALGNLLNAFIVTDHKDSLVLRECAREARYNRLQIFIYDFSRPRLSIPQHMLPQTNHPTALSVLHSDSDTVINVLVDQGNAERQVLVKDYEAGKNIAFDRRVPNLKEVYTLEGHKMFSRGSVETVLPPNRRARSARLCSSFDDQIKNLQREASDVKEQVQQCRKRKRDAELKLQDVNADLQIVKKRRSNAETDLTSKKLVLQDAKNSHVAEATSSPASSVDELNQEILKLKDQIREENMSMEDYPVRISKADEKARDLKLSFENLSESARGDIDAFEEAESELMQIEKNIHSTEVEKAHYEGIMGNKVLPDIKMAEADYKELQLQREESCKKASIICPEIEVEALGGVEGCTPEQLSAQLTRLSQRLQRENQQYSESIDDLRMLHDHMERKILRKQQMYKGFREKLDACDNALELRWKKFQRNATLLKRDLTNEFNSHLGKKGISGKIKISYGQKTLALEVKMPQDTSSITVRDTRGLSGGERSFSTLCFALALHHFTEAPFRAMDEFDVFMDAVSRKISLDTLVDFALTQGSQWIFITPHDIGMVKQHERVRKQQMAAPRS